MRACPVCQSQQRNQLYSQKFLEIEQKVLECTWCGMVYSDSPPIDHKKDNIFACPEVYGESEYEKQHHADIAWRLFTHCKARASLLDVGCSTGGLLLALKKLHFDVHGIDLSPKAVEIAKQRGLSVLCGDDPEKTYDVVTLSHVLEHVPGPRYFLSRLRDLLNPEGLLYIEVPDRSRYHLFKGITQAFNLEHINHFRMKDLVEICEKEELEVIASGRGDSQYYGGVYPSIWVMCKPYEDTIDSVIENIDARIGKLPALPESIAVWGLGQLMMRIFGKSKVKVAAATDTNPVFHGRDMLGVKVVPPSEFRPESDIPIFICSDLKQEQITDSIRSLGLTNQLITVTN